MSPLDAMPSSQPEEKTSSLNNALVTRGENFLKITQLEASGAKSQLRPAQIKSFLAKGKSVIIDLLNSSDRSVLSAVKKALKSSKDVEWNLLSLDADSESPSIAAVNDKISEAFSAIDTLEGSDSDLIRRIFDRLIVLRSSYNLYLANLKVQKESGKKRAEKQDDLTKGLE